MWAMTAIAVNPRKLDTKILWNSFASSSVSPDRLVLFLFRHGNNLGIK